MSNVVLKHLDKKYPSGFHAVRDVSLEIADGEFMVLVGPSGCGKSTTLRMIAGLEETTAGQIFIGDRLVNDVAPGDRDIAMVFQNYALYPHMSVQENMAFGLKMRGTPRKEIERRVREAADILSIESLLDRRPRELSGGQRQRVALGRAIVREPKVFLFDEPLSNLDAKLRVQMRAEIARLHQRLKTTIIYVTHDQVEAMTLGQRIVLMNHGVVQQVDTPMKIYGEPANRFVGSFIGSPAMNFFSGEVKDQKFHLTGGGLIPLANPSHTGPATIGVRPEDLLTGNDNLSGAAVPFATVTLDVVEHMGHETMVHFELAGAQHIARLGPETPAQPGDRLPLAVRPGAYHLFANDQSGCRLN
jgi:multiple sugar transport system ATP-binding protein